MVHDRRSALSGFVHDLLSRGRTVFTAGEAEEALGVGRGALLDAAERLQRRNALLSPRQGFHIAVPPQFAAWGSPPPAWYIDALMGYEGAAYYVGLLQAAELHGATHQAVMEFQVISTKRLPTIRADPNRIAFYYRKSLEGIATSLEDRKTDTGTMKISSAALTAFDLLRYPQASAGLDNVATVLADLGRKIDADQLAILSFKVERTNVQRLGHLLDRLGHEARTDPMFRTLRTRGPSPWTELDPGSARNSDLAPGPKERDARWRIVVRNAPEVDE